MSEPHGGAATGVVRLRSSQHDATAAVGAALSGLVRAGDVIVLTGPLGAGKTRFVQGLAAGLGVAARVTSPTFVLVRRHSGRIPLVHVDAYRLDDARDLLALDDEVLDAGVLTCIEWGETVARALLDERLDCIFAVEGEHGDAPRSLTLIAHGSGWSDRMGELRSELERLVATTVPLELLGGADTGAA